MALLGLIGHTLSWKVDVQDSLAVAGRGSLSWPSRIGCEQSVWRLKRRAGLGELPADIVAATG
jgi:hypothetical protein